MWLSKSLVRSVLGLHTERVSAEEGSSSVEESWDCGRGGWVLEHGLPDLPEIFTEGEAMPVAYWRGERWAAVLLLTHRPADHDPGFEPVGLDTDVLAYRWSGREWEAAASSGGGCWSDDVRVRGPALGPDEVTRLGHGWNGGREWVAGDAYGVAGRDARWVEVEQEGRVESHQIDSPLGAWVVAFDGRKPAIVRVRSDRAVLLEDLVDAVDW